MAPPPPHLALVIAFIVLVLQHPCGSSSTPPFDLTAFEDELLPRWPARFATSAAPGNYSYVPGGAPAVYGASDVAHVLYVVQQLNISAADTAQWADRINSFQNSSGFFATSASERCGFLPWHITGYATAALQLLGHRPRFNNSVYAALAATPSQWEPTLAALLAAAPSAGGCSSIWDCGHKIAAIPAVLRMTGQPADAFFRWWFAYLNQQVDPTTGSWVANPSWAPPNVQGLGGAFHMYFVYTYFGQAWPYPAATLNMSRSLQHSSTGTWGSDGAAPQYISLDGIYQITRPAQALGTPADMAAARSACTALVRTAAAALTSADAVLGKAYGANTHSLPGALAAVAECSKWFPELVHTRRPWHQCLDAAPYI